VKTEPRIKREIERLREEFKNGEKKLQEKKNNMSERVARLERRRRKVKWNIGKYQ
jgi:hypothetical protein